MIFIHPKLYKKQNFSQKISALTKLPNLAYSNSIFEDRIKENYEFSKKIQGQKIQIDYKGFVYEN